MRVAIVAALAFAAAPPAVAQPLAQRAEACFACHGKSGASTTPLTPSLGAQPSFFVVAQLFLFRDGRRGDSPMTAFAKGMSDDDLRGFGDLISKLPPPPPPAIASDPARIARGGALAREHHCPVCHNADYSGREQMPRLANQREDYLLKALRDYKSGARIGYGASMSSELAGLADAELADLAYFLARFPAVPRTR